MGRGAGDTYSNSCEGLPLGFVIKKKKKDVFGITHNHLWIETGQGICPIMSASLSVQLMLLHHNWTN